MNREERFELAVTLREAALIIVRRSGTWIEATNNPKLLFGRLGHISIAYRTPFQRLPELSRKIQCFVAGLSVSVPRNLPYGLDVWAPRKTFNCEWDDGGNVVIRSLRPGPWQMELTSSAEAENRIKGLTSYWQGGVAKSQDSRQLT
jgi:hypothetical protein